MSGPNYVTDTYKTPLIQIITWFLLASAIISVLCRAYTKWAVIKFTGLDDYFVPVSLLFLVGQSLAVTVQTTNGYGKPMQELSSSQVSAILKAEYAAMLLYIPSLVFSKLPTIVLLKLIAPIKHFHHMLYAIAILIAAWAVTSEIVSAFQCRPTRTWDYLQGQCFNRKVFYAYFEAMNAFTDLLIILVPFYIVTRVRTNLRRKISVSIVFCARILPLAVIIVKIVLQIPTYHSADILFDTWPITICTQLTQFLSLTCACILYIRPFLEALTSGFISGDDLRRRGQIKPFVLASEGVDVHLASDSEIPEKSYTTSSSGERTALDDSILRHREMSGNESDDTKVSMSSGLDIPTVIPPTPRSNTGRKTSSFKEDLESRPQHTTPQSEQFQGRPRPTLSLSLPPSDPHNGLPRVSQAYSPLVNTDELQEWLVPGESHPDQRPLHNR